MSHFKGVATPGLCQGERKNLVGQMSQTANNWAGPIVNDFSASITDVAGTFQQTGFDAVCSAQDAYSTWPGIGGTTGTGLLQDGTDVA